MTHAKSKKQILGRHITGSVVVCYVMICYFLRVKLSYTLRWILDLHVLRASTFIFRRKQELLVRDRSQSIISNGISPPVLLTVRVLRANFRRPQTNNRQTNLNFPSTRVLPSKYNRYPDVPTICKFQSSTLSQSTSIISDACSCVLPLFFVGDFRLR